jgi:hypothetical protein
MSDTSLNKYLGQGDNAAEAAFTPNPTTGTTPAQAVLFVNDQTPASPVVKWWNGAAWVTVVGGGSGTVTTTGSPANGNLSKFTGSTSISNTDLTGDVTTSGGVATTLKTAAKTRAITFTIDGGGSVPSTGVKGDISVPYACTITGARMLADQSGSAVVNVWKDTYANYPPTVADKITASAPPTITSATKSDDTTLSGWTTSITAGDTLRFNLDSITTITRVVLILTVTV